MSEKIRVGLLMYSPLLGGAEQHFKDLLWSLDRSRFEVTLFYEAWPEFTAFLGLDRCPPVSVVDLRVAEPGGHVPVPRKNGGDGQARPSRYERVVGLLRKGYRSASTGLLRRPSEYAYFAWRAALMPFNRAVLYRAFKQHPVDVLHINNGGYPGSEVARTAAIAAKRVGIPAVFMTIAAAPAPRRRPEWMERRIGDAVNRRVDRFFVVADALGRSLADLHGVPHSKIETMHYGVPNRELARSENPVPVIGMNASFIERKGHRVLFAAAKRLREEGKDFVLRFAGQGPLRPEMERMAAAYALNAEFLGQLTNAGAIAAMAAYDVVVLPSDAEGMPYVLLEAASLGKPIVATNVDGIPEIVLDGEVGLIVPPRDDLALSRALAKLLDEPALRSKLGAAAHARHRAGFSLTKMIQGHEAAYAGAARSLGGTTGSAVPVSLS